MEEHITFAVGPLTLEGLYSTPAHPPRCGVVLCHPHPLYGGDMYNNVVAALAVAMQQAGLATLRFNFRGVGRSSGTHDQGQGEMDDVSAAVTYLLGRQDLPMVAVAGYSFGSMVGLRTGVTDDRVHALIGVALPIGTRDASFLLPCTKPKLLITGDHDHVAPLPALQDLMRQLPEPKALEVIQGADHFFREQEWDVAQVATAFLLKK